MTHASSHPDAMQIEGLFSRAVDGTLSDAQWRELEAHANKSPELWRALCCAHRDELSLRAGLASVSARQVSLDSGTGADASRDDSQQHNRHCEDTDDDLQQHSPWIVKRAWMGWAAAAVLGLVAAVQVSQRASVTPVLMQAGSNLQGTQDNTAGLGSGLTSDLSDVLRTLSPQDLLTQYVQNGREAGTVYGVLPERVVLTSEPLIDGAGYEVVYLRQIVERRRVPDFYGISFDEQGNAYPVRVSPDAGDAQLRGRNSGQAVLRAMPSGV